MEKVFRILAVNPGSTSTKIALFDNEKQLFLENIKHDPDIMRGFSDVQDQLEYRRETVEQAVLREGYRFEDIDVFVGRGGGLHPLTGGTYHVTPLLALHASLGTSGQHPAQLASQICRAFSEKYGGPAFVVNPPEVDEFDEISRVTGLKGVYRESHVHALSQKEIARRYAEKRGVKYEELNLIICHLGGGVSVTAHRRGRMVDSNDIIKGSGPMTPTRSGDLPYVPVMDLAFSGGYDEHSMTNRLNKNGGLMDHLGTDDASEVEQMMADGDRYAGMIYNAMIYQIAKYVGSMACALKGDVDAVILTGGMAHSEYLTHMIEDYVGWIAPVEVMAGGFEMEALAAGALRVMRGEEEAATYTGAPVWNGFDYLMKK